MTDISTTAQNYKERVRKTLEEMPTLESIILSGRPVTQEDVDAIKARLPMNYLHREEIPESIRPYADIYHQLTGQEPTKRSFTDWVDTFWMWKDEKIQLDDIRAAWAQAQDPNKGFTVGRPGALTITAVGMRSKAKPAIAGINNKVVESTKIMAEEKHELVKQATDIPEAERERMRQWKANLARKGIAR